MGDIKLFKIKDEVEEIEGTSMQLYYRRKYGSIFGSKILSNRILNRKST